MEGIITLALFGEREIERVLIKYGFGMMCRDEPSLELGLITPYSGDWCQNPFSCHSYLEQALKQVV